MTRKRMGGLIILAVMVGIIYSSQIHMIDFPWLHDIPPEAVEEGRQGYGVADKNFAEVLATLGLRTNQGKTKKDLKRYVKKHKPEGGSQ